LIFTVGGDDAAGFFPVEVSFVGQGSLAGIGIASVTKIGDDEEAVFSVDSVVATEKYLVV
jgi:hypothetical protein